jgi:hypothetical protein
MKESSHPEIDSSINSEKEVRSQDEELFGATNFLDSNVQKLINKNENGIQKNPFDKSKIIANRNPKTDDILIQDQTNRMTSNFGGNI